MRGLFFKVFIIFWIAQSLIFVISTALIVRHHFEGPEAQFDTLDSSLQNDGKRGRSGVGKRRLRCAAGLWRRHCADGFTRRCDGAGAVQTGGHGGSGQERGDPQPHHRGPGGPAVPVEGSGLFGEREAVCVSVEPAACAAETELVTGPVAFFVSAASGGDCGGRTHNVCAGAAVYAPGDQAQEGGARTGDGKAECPRGMA